MKQTLWDTFIFNLNIFEFSCRKNQYYWIFVKTSLAKVDFQTCLGTDLSTIKINLFGHKQSCICLQYVFVVMEKMNNFSQAAKWQILLFYNFPKIHSISYFIQNIVQKKNISFCSLQTIPSLNEKTRICEDKLRLNTIFF